MCGIVAIKWVELPPALSLIDQAIEMLCQRGKDAWGIATRNDQFPLETIVVKEASRIDNRKNKQIIFNLLGKITSSGWLLLHSRLATNGFCGLSEHNHPIEFQNIQLVHNGLVVEWPNQVRHLINELNTDSQNLAIVIASSEPHDIEAILNDTIGEISVVWQNNLENTLNMYSNVGGLYLETNPEYTLVSSEPLRLESQTRKSPLRKIIEL
jgi:glucosamine 6-phosphate synthetase-like amidotransferase/phosphosugar isomerase protein